jgi:hypothetical protein
MKIDRLLGIVMYLLNRDVVSTHTLASLVILKKPGRDGYRISSIR